MVVEGGIGVTCNLHREAIHRTAVGEVREMLYLVLDSHHSITSEAIITSDGEVNIGLDPEDTP